MTQLAIGILDLQGDVIEHARAVEACGARAVRVKRPHQLAELAGLIIPGGESTTIGKLMAEYGFFEAIGEAAERGLAVYGTCAGCILLAKDIAGSDQPRLGLMNMRVQRNAFGRQRESFEIDLPIPALGQEPVRLVFIRAPYIESVQAGVEVMAEYGDKILLARQGRYLAGVFHPELTGDLRVHRYFLQMAEEARAERA